MGVDVCFCFVASVVPLSSLCGGWSIVLYLLKRCDGLCLRIGLSDEELFSKREGYQNQLLNMMLSLIVAKINYSGEPCVLLAILAICCSLFLRLYVKRASAKRALTFSTVSASGSSDLVFGVDGAGFCL